LGWKEGWVGVLVRNLRIKTDKYTDRQRDSQTERQTVRQTDRQTVRQMDRTALAHTVFAWCHIRNKHFAILS